MPNLTHNTSDSARSRVQRCAAAGAGAVLALGCLACMVLAGEQNNNPMSDHFNGKTFFNPGEEEPQGFREFLTWVRNRQRGPWEKWVDIIPGSPPEACVNGDDLHVTYINHSTFLIQLEELNILIDPIWSKRCSPVSFAGPKRVHAPGIRFEDLPRIDVVLITHNHYDHMDIPTLKRLNKAFAPRIYVPLGNRRTLKRHGMNDVVEMDWWQELPLSECLTLVCVPAKHFSSRSMWDHGKALWSGFVIEGGPGAVYAAGDTGFGPHFEQIAKRFPDISVAMLPIGAFLPKWFMAPHHISPRDALRAHTILNARTSIAEHFGTFPLGDDGQHEPEEALAGALKSHDLGTSRFLLPHPGQVFTDLR
jgi:L-ascorbate metabolism protein UlaG (beta-lactamase superfamily)